MNCKTEFQRVLREEDGILIEIKLQKGIKFLKEEFHQSYIGKSVSNFVKHLHNNIYVL